MKSVRIPILCCILLQLLFAADISEVPTILPTRLENVTIMPSGKSFWMAAYSPKVSGETAVNTIAYSPDAKFLYVGESSGPDSALFKYELSSGKTLWRSQPFKKISGGSSYPDISAIEISKSGKKLAVHPPFSELGVSTEIRMVNTANGESDQVIRIPSFHPKCSGVYDDKTLMLTFPASKFGLSDRYLYLYAKNERGSNMYGCLVNLDRWIIKYDLTTRKRVWQYNITQPGIPKYSVPENSCSHPMPSIDITTDEKLVVFSDCTGTITALDASNGKEKLRSEYLDQYMAFDRPGFSSVVRIKTHPRNKNIVYVAAGESGSKTLISEFDLSKKKFSQKFITAVNYGEPKLAFSPDGALLVTGALQNLNIFSVAQKKILYSTFSSAGGGNAFAVNPLIQEIAVPMGNEITFYQPRPKRPVVSLSSSQNTDTKLTAAPGTATIIVANTKFILTLGGRELNAYTYDKIDHWGNTNTSLNKDGTIALRAVSSSGSAEIFGGLTTDEVNSIAAIRKKVPKWGKYAGQGGESGTSNPVNPVKTTEPSSENLPVVDAANANEELKYGILQNKLPVVKAALKAGADPNYTGDLKKSMLMMAANDNNATVIKLLLDAGAKIEQTDFMEQTALFDASGAENEAILKTMLAAKPNVNHQGKTGQTPLMRAAAACRVKNIQLLIKAKANMKLKNEEGKTASEIMKTSCNFNKFKEAQKIGLR